MKFALIAPILLLAASLANAADKCDGLAPTNAQGVSDDFKGKIEGKINGILGRLAGGNASIDGEYHKLITDELKHYPHADKLYVWQRIIYLACINPDIKIDINRLFELYLKGPIQASGSGKATSNNQRTTQSRPEATPTYDWTDNSTANGDHNIKTEIINGDNNTVTNSTVAK